MRLRIFGRFVCRRVWETVTPKKNGDTSKMLLSKDTLALLSKFTLEKAQPILFRKNPLPARHVANSKSKHVVPKADPGANSTSTQRLVPKPVPEKLLSRFMSIPCPQYDVPQYEAATVRGATMRGSKIREHHAMLSQIRQTTTSLQHRRQQRSLCRARGFCSVPPYAAEPTAEDVGPSSAYYSFSERSNQSIVGLPNRH